MSYNTSLQGYPDITQVLDRALDATKGVRVSFDDEKAAMTFCGRVHTFRSLDRKANSRIYPLGDPMHARSVYDPLRCSRKGAVVEVERLAAVEFVMEEIE